MSTETATEPAVPRWTALEPWHGGLLAGLLGGLAFGIMLSLQMTDMIERAIPALYGFGSSGLVGWVIHMSHAAILGVVFAILVDLAGLHDRLSDNLRMGLAGIVYGVVLWVALAVLLMPLWLQGVDFGGAPAFPNPNVQSLVGHIVYGVVVGIAFSVLVEETS
jgi:uncharacterized membrane protein YagU involved in acid resistance